jgi:hypothetical protein
MTASDGVSPQVGYWYAPCCIHDLRQITNAEQLASAIESSAEIGGTFWPTFEEAHKELMDDEVQAQRFMDEKIAALRARLDAAERERDSLRHLVRRSAPHLRHRWDCASLVVESRERGVHDPRDPCNCGLDAALKET